MHTLSALFLIFLYELGTAIVLPTPSGFHVFAHSWIPLGWIFLFAVAGKAVGAYLLFFLGDRVKGTDHFRRLTERHPWLRLILRVSERFVHRYGVFAIFVLLSVPGFPDTVSLYLFALVGKRPVLFALASGLGTAVRMGLILAGFRGLVGAAT
jgi:uncharacterized membrane protein YdjX (TVP38/TMEM64 family)